MSTNLPINAQQQIKVARLTHKVQPSVKTPEKPLKKDNAGMHWLHCLYTKDKQRDMKERRGEGRNRRSLQKKTGDVGADKTNTNLNCKRR